MASDSDDADFFDKLVDSDSDDDRRPPTVLPVAAADGAEASAGDLAALTLDDQEPHPKAEEPPPPPTVEESPSLKAEEPEPAAAPPPHPPTVEEPPSLKAEEPEPAPAPPSLKAEEPEPAAAALPDAQSEAHPRPAGVHPEAPPSASPPRPDVKQAQWNDFGATSEGDPFGAAAFFEGDDQASLPQATTMSVDDRGISGSHLDTNANSHLDSAEPSIQSVDQSSSDAQLLHSADPAYWESLYPGWKYDAATQQWYQVDALSAHQDAVEVQAPAVEITGAEPELMPAAVHPKAQSETAVEAHPVLPNADSKPPQALLEGSSPSSDKGTPTAIKQVQWNDFGVSNEADPFGDLVADGVEDAFFEGAMPMPGDQALQSTTLSAVDHSFSSGVLDTKDNPQLASVNQSNGTQLDSADPKYWESVYPGWKYDGVTRQWYQIADDNSNTLSALGADNVQQQQFGPSFVQNSSHAMLETIVEEGSTNAATWGQDGSYIAPTEYPPNMLFYAEYPGWYFDTNTQQWQSLESYQQTVAQTAEASGGIAGIGQNAPHTQESYTQQSQWQPGALSNSMQPGGSADNSLLGSFYDSDNKSENQTAQPLQSSTNYINTFVPSASQYTATDNNQASYEGFQPSNSHQSAYKGLEQSTSDQSSSKDYQSGYTTSATYVNHQGFKPVTSNQSWNKGFGRSTGQEVGYKGFEPSTGHRTSFEPSRDNQVSHVGFEPSTNRSYGNFVPRESMYKEQTHGSAQHMHLPDKNWGTHNSVDFAQQQSIGPNGPSQQFGFSPHEQRSSAGRPPHALVTFGFGGKLVVLKEISSITGNFDSRNQGTVSILNIPEIVADKIDHSSIPSSSALSYFHALCRNPVPGPLVGGSAAAKDVNKWFDDVIGGYESSAREFQGGDVHKLLISLLKILCQHYGKLRSPFGSDPAQEGVDGPEMAVTKLFASYKSNANMKGYGAVVHCMKNIPLESQIQATAQEVQNLLVSGRRKEALQCAQEGQLWGPALILALQLGDKFYADTVKKMADCHFVSGSPLRTLCLLIAGQPADVFNFENHVDSGSLHTAQPPVEASPKSMLDDWQENLAILTANRTKGDDLVITHLGDCLWKEKNEVASAHSCYLVAELNIDSYSESARMCLIGADHLQCPRTFASPEAIQRMELYEYAKVLGNSQYILLPFQPYKLIYAYMLAEVGKVSDSLRYCQASLRVLKASGRTPELEALKQSFLSLEERIRTHQQGGYATNLAPGKIVGKIFTSLDKSLSRMMGTQPAPLPQMPQGAANERHISAVPDTKVANTQPVISMSPLMSSTSELSMSEMSGVPERKAAHNRSISEPDFGRAPPKGAGSGNAQSISGSGSSRFGWLVQKTMGLVSKPHKQAKLGEQNKFYYDEKLKRWVEEGAEVPAEEPPLPPPPTKASFQNTAPDYNLNGPVGGHTANGYADAKTSNPSELSSGMPPIPPTQNQFAARGRMGVRSRYVDTFNKGSGASAFGAAASFSKPVASSMSPPPGAKFFMPTPAAVASEQMSDPKVDAQTETSHQDQRSSSPALEAPFNSPPPTIQWHPSMDNIMTPSDSVGSSLSRSRAASWSGTYSDQFNSSAVSRSPDGQMMQSQLMPGRRPPHSRSSSNSSAQFSGMGEDLHEVEL